MDNTVKSFHRLLSIVGFSIYAKKNWDSRAWLVLLLCNYFVEILTILFEFLFLTCKVSNLFIFIQAACIWTTELTVFVMFGIYFFFKNDFRKFLEECFFNDLILDIPLIQNVLNSKQNHAKLTELKELVVISQENLFKYTRLLLKCFAVSAALCCTLYIGGPIYFMITTNDQSLRLLAFDMWFPWGLENFKVYIACFIFNTYAGYRCAIVYPGVQLTIGYFIYQLIRQIRILTFILQHLDVLALELVEDKHNRWQPVCTELLTQCIVHYVKLKRFSNRLNSICRPFYLTVLLVAVILFCMCSVKIAISDKLSLDTTKYYIHLTCCILMMLAFCLAGQQVINECDKLEMALTEKWYIYDARHKRHMLIFKMALNQNMPIYIFGTITLSLPTFTWVIRTGLSVFTLIMSFF